MDFLSRYNEIISCIKGELESFDRYFESELLEERTQITPVLDRYFANKGKRIRTALIFLLTKALGSDVGEAQFKLAFADEMIHNATLIHDDIVDESLTRRGEETINAGYDNKLAVLAGDYLLALALKALSSLENLEVHNIHSSSMLNIINGEISQYFKRDEIPTIEEYIEKSKNKTAELFRTGLCSAALLCEKSENYTNIEDFAINFGIAFQIHNDLKELAEDIKNGIYTAPLIYYLQEKTPEDFSLGGLENSRAIDKTQDLINICLERAIENISFLEDNQYKHSMIELGKLHRGLNSANR